MSKAEIRAPQIFEMEVAGHTQQEIADSLGVSRMQIWRDRQTPLYETMINHFLQKYIDGINDFLEGEEKTFKLEVLKELGRMYRAGMTKRTTHTEDLQATVNINVTETRKQKDELLKSLELSDDQWRIIEENVKTEKE